MAGAKTDVLLCFKLKEKPNVFFYFEYHRFFKIILLFAFR